MALLFAYQLELLFFSHGVELESIWEANELVILNAMRLFIPFNQVHCSSWFTANIRHHIKCLRTLRRRHKRHMTRYLEEKIKLSEESLQEEIAKNKAII